MTESSDETGSQPHMLDGCDANECYKTMMTERTDLIKARREAEDNLVKTVVQLSATLMALTAGFITQTSVSIQTDLFPILIGSLFFLLLALIAGLSEHVFSSKAYLAQQYLVERFYSKQIDSFSEPTANKWVRRCQFASFGSFFVALATLGVFAILQAGERSHGRSQVSTATATSTTAAAAAAQANRRQCIRSGNKVGSTINAAAASEKGELIPKAACLQ